MKFFYAILFIFIVFVILEILARLLYFLRTKKFFLRVVDPIGKATFFKEHPYCFYVKRENNEGIYPTNSHGYVGKIEPTVPGQRACVRFYFVGGSTTEEIDLSLGPESHWPALYTGKLNEHFPDLKFDCINAACSGYTSAESLSEFLYRGLDLRPHYLFVYHNVNDAWTVQMRKEFRSDYSSARVVGRLKRPLLARAPQIPLSYLYQLLRRKLMAGFVHRGLMHYISDPPWTPAEYFDESRVEPFKRNIINLVHICRLWGCTPIILKWEHAKSISFQTALYSGQPSSYENLYSSYIDKNNRALKEIASQYGVMYYDLGPMARDCFQPDGMHFTMVGRREFARRLFEKSKTFFSVDLQTLRC
jgi:lysophospholipase L1-like esterase